MHPVLVVLGVPLHVYTLAYVLGGLLGGLLAFHRLVQLHPPRRATTLIAVAVAVGMAGAVALARALELAAGGGAVSATGGAHRGITILGFQLLGGLALLAILVWRRWPVGATFDLVIPGMPLLQAVGRLGCLAQGCCGGRPSAGALAMNLPGIDGRWLPRHPTQLLAAAADLAILGTLLLVERRAARRGGLPFAGFLAVLFALLTLGKRLLLEPLREQSLPPLGPLTPAQAFCLLGLLVAGALLLLGLARARRALLQRRGLPPEIAD